MREFAFLMVIFGVCIFLYGVYVKYSKNPFVPRTYNKKLKKKDRLLLAKSLMAVSMSPILSALVAVTGDNLFVFWMSWLILILSFIFILKLVIRTSK